MIITKSCNPIGMSYWRNINFHAGSNVLQVFLSIKDELHIFTIRKDDLALIDVRNIGITHTGEGCWFSAIDPNRLFIPINGSLICLDTSSARPEQVWKIANRNLWQCHGSHNDNVFSATIRNENYQDVAWGVYRDGVTQLFDLAGESDECQIDKSGNFLLIKEDNYNRVLNLVSGRETKITDQEGALGHSDCGFECAIGENDQSALAGACDEIDFVSMSHRNIYSTGIWNMGYVSYQNNQILISTPVELIHVGSGKKWNHGNTSEQYEHRVKANLCPLGEYFAYTAFIDGSLVAVIEKL